MTSAVASRRASRSGGLSSSARAKRRNPGYLRAFHHDARNQRVHIEVVGVGVPMTVVEKAIERRDEAAREARVDNDVNLLFDDVWGVFDVDAHPHVGEARAKAAASGIDLAISNPCIELWALLHFQEQRAHIERDKAASHLKKHMPGYEKRLDFAAMKPGYEAALRRAGELDREAQQHAAPGRNPTTGIFRLTELIRSA
jgi:hypothetical protein